MDKSQFQLSKAAIKTGSKSFRLASLILDQKSQRGAYILYRWCRYCDDVIDEAPTKRGQQLALQTLNAETQKALAGEGFPDSSAFSGLFGIAQEFNIAGKYFFELLEGFRMDVDQDPLRTFEDLKKYCYHVAGVVGLMMSSILQAKDPKALVYADSLGRAMQLTNISRDVREDFVSARIYIPGDWLAAEGIGTSQLLDAPQREKLFKLVLQLLESADVFYDEGRKGLEFLPFRAAWSISIASFLYQGIGHKIKKRGVQALEARTVLNTSEKIKYVVLGSFHFLGGRFKSVFFSVKEGSV